MQVECTEYCTNKQGAVDVWRRWGYSRDCLIHVLRGPVQWNLPTPISIEESSLFSLALTSLLWHSDYSCPQKWVGGGNLLPKRMSPKFLNNHQHPPMLHSSRHRSLRWVARNKQMLNSMSSLLVWTLRNHHNNCEHDRLPPKPPNQTPLSLPHLRHLSHPTPSTPTQCHAVVHSTMHSSVNLLVDSLSTIIDMANYDHVTNIGIISGPVWRPEPIRTKSAGKWSGISTERKRLNIGLGPVVKMSGAWGLSLSKMRFRATSSP